LLCVAGLAGGLPAPAGALRATRRHPAGLGAAGVRAELSQLAEPGEGM